QRSRKVYLGSGQRLRYGTVLLGLERIPLECRVVDARNLGLGLQLDPGDGEPFADLLELHLRARVDARRRQSRARKVRGQRHREAPGVSGADQLLRVGGGLAFLESGFERIRAVKGTAADSQPPAAFGQIPLPFCFCLSCWHGAAFRLRFPRIPLHLAWVARYWAVYPPSIGTIWPVTNDAPAEHSQTTALATSWGWPMRPMGCADSSICLTSGEVAKSWNIRVSIAPGATAFTRRFCFAYSSATAFVNSMPALLKAQSSLPNFANVRSIIALTSLSFETSVLMKIASPPDASISATTPRPSFSRRPLTTTCAPCLANSAAVARPIPALPPVTRTTLPAN